MTAATAPPDDGRRPPDASTTVKLIGLGRILHRRFEAELGGTGLTWRHLGALGHLSRDPELSYSALARRAHVTSQSMNATVRHLEGLGAVRRHGAAPGRPARLEVTDVGRQLLDTARSAARRLDTELEAVLGPTGQRSLDQAVQELFADQVAATLREQTAAQTWG